jgi:hypothetical protein
MPADRESGSSRSKDTRVCFGGTEATTDNLVLTTSIRDLARAEFRLHLDDAEGAAPDYLALVEIEIDQDSVFTGTTVSATPSLSGVSAKCASGVELDEGLMGRLSSEDTPAQDLVFAAARAAGFPESHIEIHQLEDLPLEPIEVVVPLRGVRVDAPCRVGRVDLHPAALGHRALDAFDHLSPEFVTEFEAAQSYAVVVHTVQRLYDAEVLALADVDLALGWLALRARYGYARLPDGQAQRFRRDTARCLPDRAGLIAVRGLGSGRRWVRDPQGAVLHPDLSLGGSDAHLWPAPPARFPFADRHAVLAARRAAGDGDDVERITAFWRPGSSTRRMFGRSRSSRRTT